MPRLQMDKAMELMIALAAEEGSLLRSKRVRSILEKSYSSLFANVFVRVYDIADRSHIDVSLVKNMSPHSVPVLVTLEDQKGTKVTAVAEIPDTSSGIERTTDNVVVHFECNGKHETVKLEPRTIQVRGIDYAVAATIARRSHKYIDFAP